MESKLPKILEEPEKSDITVFSVQLYQQYKHKNEGKDDALFITYKNDKNVKKVRMITNPQMEIFFVKPEYRSEFNTPRGYLEEEKTYSKLVDARWPHSVIYRELKNCKDPQSLLKKSIYEQAELTGNKYAKKEVYRWPYTMFSDMKVEDYYRIQLGYRYNCMRNHIIDKGYLDIEADLLRPDGKTLLTTSEQNANMDRVNACTIMLNFDPNRDKKMKPMVYTFLLRDYDKYPQQEEFEKHLPEFIETLHKDLDHQTVTKKGKKTTIDFEAEYNIKFYDEEKDLILDIFRTINKYRPDVMSVWNIAYDIPKLAARAEALGVNYIDMMCDPAFPKPYRFVEMNIDRRPDIDIADRKTYIRMASTTLWNDQMQTYAGLRKGRKAYGANSLDNISNVELGVGKHQFGKGIDVMNAVVKDYYNFVYYNIIDVMRQVLIDIVTNDTMAMIYDMNQANTPLENLFKQTRYQRQIYYTHYLEKGFIPGNNPNVNYIKGESEDRLEWIEEVKNAAKRRADMDREDMMIGSDFVDSEIDNEVEEQQPEEFDQVTQEAAEKIVGELSSMFNDRADRKISIPGGMVGDPDLNSPNGAELIPGVKSKHVYRDAQDMDYASEYPWGKVTRNMSKETQIRRLVIPKKVSDRQCVLPMNDPKRPEELKSYLPGAEFFTDYLSNDVVSFANTWFNLKSSTEMLRGFEKFRAKKEG